MKVYLSEYIAPTARNKLEKEFEIVTDFNHPEELDGIIVRRVKITRDIIKKAKRLKVISMHGVGFDTIDLNACKEYGIEVVNVPGLSAQSVAELAVSFIMALSRKHKMIDKGLCEGRFTKFGMSEMIGNEIYGKKLGLVGGGHVANKVATIMRNAFSCQIYCYDPYKTEEECFNLGYSKVNKIEELFQIADFINVSVPLVEGTKNLINSNVFECANPNLILVNTSRGGVVDEEALYDALITGKIKAAASDVFVSEPPNKDCKLIHLDNFIATLHIGGSTEESLERVGNKAVDNLISRIRCIEKKIVSI